MQLATPSAHALDKQTQLQETSLDGFTRTSVSPSPADTWAGSQLFRHIGRFAGRAGKLAAVAVVLLPLGPVLALMYLVRLLHEQLLEQQRRAEELAAWENEMDDFDRF